MGLLFTLLEFIIEITENKHVSHLKTNERN